MKHKILSIAVLAVLAYLLPTKAQTGSFGYTTPPDSTSTDTVPVGTPAINFDVSPLGAATFAIPIECPQGLPGMTPQLSIAYNSQSGNGIAGYGCNLSGMSAITRVPRDIFHDGQAHGMNYTHDDGFSLDGKRLILTQAAAGSDSAVYCLEDNPYTRIVHHGLLSSEMSDEWFSVEMPDGMRYEYGKTIFERQCYYLNGTFNNMVWYVNKVCSPNETAIVYDYSIVDGYRYLTEIRYGYFSDARICLEYEERPDTLWFRQLGFSGSIGRRLASVSTARKVGGIWHTYRRYTLDYSETADGTSMKYSRLVNVTEANDRGQTLRPLVLHWEGLPGYAPSVVTQNIDYNGFTNQTVEIVESGTQIMAADFNGDGISDILEKANVNVRPGDGWVHHYTDYYYRLSQVSQDGSVVYGYPLLRRLDSDVAVPNWTVKCQGPMLADADGDGLSDLLVPYTNTGNYYHYVWIYYLYGKDVSDTQTTPPHKLYTLQHSNEDPLLATCDLDGDGRSEVVILEAGNNGGNSYDCCIFSGAGNVGDINDIHLTLTLSSKPKYLFVSDYNNDGATDLLVSHDNGYAVFWNQGGSLSTGIFNSSPSQTGSFSYNLHRLYEGDFNGDGTPDFLVTNKNSSTWLFALGRGNGTFEMYDACNIDAFEQTATHKDDDYLSCSILDIDGDGRSDAVISKAVFAKHSDLTSTYYRLDRVVTYWLLSDGKRLNILSTQTSNNLEDSSPRYYMTGDFNGDGLLELANYGYNCFSGNTPSGDELTRIYTCSGFTKQSGKITSMTDGLGNSTLVTYDTFASPSVYSRNDGNADGYPVITVSQPLNVVKSTVTGNGAAGQTEAKYSYTGLRVHVKGRGLMGMTSTKCTNLTDSIISETVVISWDEASYRPDSTVTTKSTGLDTETVSSSYIHQERLCANGRKAYFGYPAVETVTDLDGNTFTTTRTYNTQIGVPIQIRTVNAGGQRVTSFSDYVQRGIRYLPGKTETTTTYTGKQPFTETSVFTYDAKGQCTTLTSNPNSPYAVTASYSYDNFGNMLSSTMQDDAGNLETVTKTWSFDSTKRNVLSTTERGYIVNEFTYDLWGDVLTETDRTRTSHPLTTAHTYNGWGRRVTTILPDSTVTRYTTGWAAGTANCYWTLEQGTARPWVKTWHDSRGRVVLTQSIGQKDICLSSSNTYNEKGLLTQRTNSRGNSSVVETFAYDSRGRILKDTLSTGSGTSYTYQPNKVTTKTGGRTIVKEYDAWGNIVKTTDALETVTNFSYESCGKPASVTSCGSTVTMEYDEIGNQTRLTDPDAGTMTYTYDAYGRIKTQTDGRNITTTNSYDTKGRLSSTVTGSVTTTYTYGQTSSDMGLLLSTSRSSNTIAYEYDQFGRVSQETRTVSGLGTRSFQYTYGGNGLLEATQYPGQVSVGYQYDCYGNRSAVTANGNTVWQMANITAQSSHVTTTARLGGSLKSTLVTDLAGRTTAKSLGYYASGSPIRSMTFTYDATTGNLTGRTGMATTAETFTYDNLDRLTGIACGGSTAQAVSYSNSGNITSKTGIGNYFYDDTRPHAVSAVENTGLVIPLQQLNTQFNSFGKVSQIVDYSTNNYRMTFDYGPDNERWRTKLFKNNNTLKRTTYYMGDYEEIVEGSTTRQLYYLDGNVLYKKQASCPDSVFYIFTDHLGSVVAIVDQNGSEKFHATYDAWGNQTVTRNDIGFHRGYTGHEMLPEFGLINMNGRLYDPLIGRFLSTDNFVQEPWNCQNFNRYSYCLNNPLKYTDPDGELFGIDDVLLLSVAYGFYSNIMMSIGNGESAWKGALRGGISAVTAIVGSYATNGIGEILGHTSQSWETELMRAGMHGFVNGAVSEANGGSFWNGFATGFSASAVGSTISFTGVSSDYILPSMALSGGIASQLTGGEFLFGAMDGIGIGMLNHRWEILPDGTPNRILDDVYVTGHYKGGIPLMTVTRFAETINSTLSKYEIIAQKGNCSGYILERGGPETALKDLKRRIPVGIYDMDYTYSPRFGKKLYLISNSVVGKDRGIRLHTGNYYYDSTGCLLPGSSFKLNSGSNAYEVSSSGKELNKMMHLLEMKKSRLVIIDNIP